MSGMIDDVRTLLQDLVTPDLKSLQVRVLNIEAKLGDGVPALKDLLSERLNRLEALIITNATMVQSQVKAVEAQVKVLETQLDLAKRVEELERQYRQPAPAQAEASASQIEAQQTAGV